MPVPPFGAGTFHLGAGAGHFPSGVFLLILSKRDVKDHVDHFGDLQPDSPSVGGAL